MIWILNPIKCALKMSFEEKMKFGGGGGPRAKTILSSGYHESMFRYKFLSIDQSWETKPPLYSNRIEHVSPLMRWSGLWNRWAWRFFVTSSILPINTFLVELSYRTCVVQYTWLAWFANYCVNSRVYQVSTRKVVAAGSPLIKNKKLSMWESREYIIGILAVFIISN